MALNSGTQKEEEKEEAEEKEALNAGTREEEAEVVSSVLRQGEYVCIYVCVYVCVYVYV